MDTHTHPRMVELQERGASYSASALVNVQQQQQQQLNLHRMNIEAADPITSIKAPQKSPKSQTEPPTLQEPLRTHPGEFSSTLTSQLMVHQNSPKNTHTHTHTSANQPDS